VHEALQLAQPWPDEEAGSSSDSSAAAAGDEATAPEAAAAAEGEAAALAAPAAGMQQSRRRFRFSNVAARVWWFDAQLQAALDAPAPTGLRRRQVVVLGAGLDTRPWRLAALPRGVRWFEVDLPEVAAAKRELLASLGAALEAGAAPAAALPLRVASYALLAADLGHPGWAAALLQRGLDPQQPTVWVAEGGAGQGREHCASCCVASCCVVACCGASAACPLPSSPIPRSSLPSSQACSCISSRRR
jgi:methyltransferase (TIGR00027 family)